MSTELQEALARAADGGRAQFEARELSAVIAPATRRVRRHRAAVRTVQVAGAFVALGGALWGIELAANSTTSVADEPPSTEHTYVTDDVTAPATAITAHTLAREAVPYTRGAINEGRQAGLWCSLTSSENLRLQELGADTSDAYAATDCQTVWLAAAPLLEFTGGLPETGGIAGADTVDSLAVPWGFTNVTDAPLVLDAASVTATLTLDRDGGPAADFSVQGLAVTGTSLWQDDSTKMAMLHHRTDEVTLQPGESISGQLEWTFGGDQSAVEDAISRGAEFTCTFYIRIPNADPNVPNELMLEVDLPWGPLALNPVAAYDDAIAVE